MALITLVDTQLVTDLICILTAYTVFDDCNIVRNTFIIIFSRVISTSNNDRSITVGEHDLDTRTAVTDSREQIEGDRTKPSERAGHDAG